MGRALLSFELTSCAVSRTTGPSCHPMQNIRRCEEHISRSALLRKTQEPSAAVVGAASRLLLDLQDGRMPLLSDVLTARVLVANTSHSMCSRIRVPHCFPFLVFHLRHRDPTPLEKKQCHAALLSRSFLPASRTNASLSWAKLTYSPKSAPGRDPRKPQLDSPVAPQPDRTAEPGSDMKRVRRGSSPVTRSPLS